MHENDVRYKIIMEKQDNKITVNIFAPSLSACAEENSWEYAVKMTGKRLQKRYGDVVDTRFVELFSVESFDYPDIMKLVEEDDREPPYVTINGRLVHSGGKISERAIRDGIEKELKQIKTMRTYGN